LCRETVVLENFRRDAALELLGVFELWQRGRSLSGGRLEIRRINMPGPPTVVSNSTLATDHMCL
jgi:hypothetical protein